MANPTFDNVLGYVVEVEVEIRKATSAWKAYGYAVARAYSEAYNDQGTALKKVSANLEQMRKDEEAIMTLALTILTVGVGGPIVSSILKGKVNAAVETAVKGVKDDVTKEAFKAAGEMAKDSVSDLSKKGLEVAADKVTKGLQSPSREEAFQPSGVPPDQYGDDLQEAIEEATGALEDDVLGFMRKGSAGMTMDGAKRLSTGILNSDFIKHPPGAVNNNKLKKCAAVALWLAWAWDRDEKYWQVHSLPTMFAKELMAFEPVRQALVGQVGIPAGDISQDTMGYLGRKQTVIDMYGFIRWSYSPGARAALFAGMPANPMGRKYAEMQLQERLLKTALQKMGVDT